MEGEKATAPSLSHLLLILPPQGPIRAFLVSSGQGVKELPLKRGRPKGSTSKGGRKAKKKAKKDGDRQPHVDTLEDDDMEEDDVEEDAGHGPVQSSARGKTKTDWSSGEGLAKMTKAIEDWQNKTGSYPLALAAIAGNKISLTQYATHVGIPPSTLSKHVSGKIALGAKPGAKPAISEEQQEVLVDVLIRADRANDPKNMKELVDIVQVLNPDLSREAASQCYRRTIRPAHSGRVTGLVTAQPTTTKRSACTVTQQWRWHSLVDSTWDEIVELNREESDDDPSPAYRSAFVSVMQHFVANLDEAGMQAQAGIVKVVGEKGKKKHEKKLQDSRISVTLLRVGTAGGANGPMAILLEGQKLRPGFTDEFLVRNGAPVGSCFVMTPSAFMTMEAWREIAPKLIIGLRALPIVCDHPDWWMWVSADGGGQHFDDLEVMQLFRQARIMFVKEEADSSHNNQPYDKFVAKEDKIMHREMLGILRKCTAITRGVVDQYGLVHVALAVVRNSTAKHWEDSFKATNLHPKFRKSFSEWCEKIMGSLQAGASFKIENPVEKHWLLPSFWLGMTPEERLEVMAVIDEHGAYTKDCLMDLNSKCHIAFTDMQKVRVCYNVAIESPETLQFTMLDEPAHLAVDDGSHHPQPAHAPGEAVTTAATRYRCRCHHHSHHRRS